MDFSTLFYGLTSALSWGIADFSGGFATRRGNVIGVIIISQIFGVFLLGSMALFWDEPISAGRDLWLGAIGGLCGGVGLIVLYRGLAAGQMGVFAPTTAVLTAVMPLLVAFFVDGVPALRQLIGFVFGLAAIWLLSFSGHKAGFRFQNLAQPALAGTGFGLFFVLIDQISPGSLFWPLVAARAASITMLGIVALARHVTGHAKWSRPSRPQLLPIISAGIFDAGGNVLFALATQSGRLDIAAMLASLYPGTTVLLAWILLNERLSRFQWLGVLAALLAVGLISA